MFGFGKKARIRVLDQRFGSIMYVLGNSGDAVAIKAMEGFAMGVAVGIQQRDAAKGRWDQNMTLLHARELEKTANKLHHAGDTDFAKGMMLASMLEECQCIDLPEARVLVGRLQQILAGASKELGKQQAHESVPPAFAGWYLAFKRGAAEVNPSLLSEDGSSIIDSMEKGPLLQAFHDREDPITLGREFAGTFDVSKFG